jgi:AAA domain
MSKNPFVVGKPVSPELFIGRKYEIAVSFAQISQRGHLAIWGGPGMGRTSFLELLASPKIWEKHGLDPSEAVIALVSCENINPFTPTAFWREVLSVMRDNLESEAALQADIEKLLQKGQTTKDSLNKILQKLGKKHKFLVLLINDFDIALQENEEYSEADMQLFLSECRSLAVASPGGKHLSMVVTSLKRLNELGPQLNPNASPWYNHYLFQSLKPLNDKEVEQLLGVMPMTLALREAIREIAGRDPRLLQIAGFLLYAQLQTNLETNKVPDVQTFIKNFETDTRHIFQNAWNRCSEIEQTLLMLVALSDLKGRLHKKKNFDLGNIDLIFTQRGRELTNLEEQGVIIRKQEEDKTVYSFASLMMQYWVIQEVWNTDSPLMKDREKVFLQLISHKQLSQIISIWEHKDDVLSTIEWFGKLVAAFPKGFILS